METRPYEESDEPDVVALWNEVFPDALPWNDPADNIRLKLAVQRDLFLVAMADSCLVGTAMAGFDGHRGWVYFVAVKPSHRKRGIATALMRAVEHALQSLGCPKLNLQVRSSNPDAVHFYERLGYAVEDHISMGKCLGPASGAGVQTG